MPVPRPWEVMIFTCRIPSGTLTVTGATALVTLVGLLPATALVTTTRYQKLPGASVEGV